MDMDRLVEFAIWYVAWTTFVSFLTTCLGLALAWAIAKRQAVRALARRGRGWRWLIIALVTLLAGALLPGLASFALDSGALDGFYRTDPHRWELGTAGLDPDRVQQLYEANRPAVAGELWLRGWAPAAYRLVPSLYRPCYAAQPVVCRLADAYDHNSEDNVFEGTGNWEWWLLFTLGVVPALSAGLLARWLTDERNQSRPVPA
jgi:hypothetical protein